MPEALILLSGARMLFVLFHAMTKQADKNDLLASRDKASAPVDGDAAASNSCAEATEADREAAEAPAADLQADIAALNDRLLRLQADFDNFRKRTHRERIDMRRQGAEEVIVDLLPVLDHFEMGVAAAAAQGAPESLRAGFEMVLGQFQAVLAKHGVSAIESVGQPFDPHCHEAVAHEPSADEKPDVVLRETRRGYRMGNRLLRPAQVIVASAPPAGEAAAEASNG